MKGGEKDKKKKIEMKGGKRDGKKEMVEKRR